LIRRELSQINPEVALVEPRTLRERVDDSIFVERMIATLSGFFGCWLCYWPPWAFTA
jgi:hypothetical protein